MYNMWHTFDVNENVTRNFYPKKFVNETNVNYCIPLFNITVYTCTIIGHGRYFPVMAKM